MKGAETLGTSESTVKATENYNPSGPPGRRSQTQPRRVRRIHRRKRFLRRQRGAEAPVSQGRGVQTLARPTCRPPHSTTALRRGSYQDRVTKMKSRPTQFGVRENTASSRQHDPRMVFEHGCNTVRADVVDPGGGLNGPSHAASDHAATEGERKEENHLLTVGEVAELLQVPVSWVYEQTRRRCPSRIPGFRLGKYWRFSPEDVTAWLAEKRTNDYHHARKSQ
jgi:excisionase family DNA binding protein